MARLPFGSADLNALTTGHDFVAGLSGRAVRSSTSSTSCCRTSRGTTSRRKGLQRVAVAQARPRRAELVDARGRAARSAAPFVAGRAADKFSARSPPADRAPRVRRHHVDRHRDHGVAFACRPSDSRGRDADVSHIMWTPLFVKYPHQHAGGCRTIARTLDRHRADDRRRARRHVAVASRRTLVAARTRPAGCPHTSSLARLEPQHVAPAARVPATTSNSTASPVLPGSCRHGRAGQPVRPLSPLSHRSRAAAIGELCELRSSRRPVRSTSDLTRHAAVVRADQSVADKVPWVDVHGWFDGPAGSTTRHHAGGCGRGQLRDGGRDQRTAASTGVFCPPGCSGWDAPRDRVPGFGNGSGSPIHPVDTGPLKSAAVYPKAPGSTGGQASTDLEPSRSRWFHVPRRDHLRGRGLRGSPLRWLTQFGPQGVAVFFTLSGFLLSRPFSRCASSRRTSALGDSFWFRRVVRIYPAYWVTLLSRCGGCTSQRSARGTSHRPVRPRADVLPRERIRRSRRRVDADGGDGVLRFAAPPACCPAPSRGRYASLRRKVWVSVAWLVILSAGAPDPRVVGPGRPSLTLLHAEPCSRP